MPRSGFSLDVLLGTQQLRIAANEQGTPQYAVETISGGEIISEPDGEVFQDVFSSWHKGGFVKEMVQDGYYFESINVDCTKPGEIKPGPRRVSTINVADGGALNHYGVNGLGFYQSSDLLMVLIRKENAGADNKPNNVTVRWIDSTLALNASATDGADLSTNTDDDAPGGSGFSSLIFPYRRFSGATEQLLVYVGSAGYLTVTPAALGGLVAVNTHGFAQSGGRVFRVGLSGIRPGVSNAATNADLSVSGVWTALVDLFDIEAFPSSLCIADLDGVPFISTPHGIWNVGEGGFPQNLTPQFIPLTNAFRFHSIYPLKKAAGGLVFGMYGNGVLVYLSRTYGAHIGPSTNPLVDMNNSLDLTQCYVSDIHEAPNGNLWVLFIWPNSSIGRMELLCGVKRQGAEPGPGTYSWHSVWRNDSSEGGPNGPNSDFLPRPFLPFKFKTSASNYIAIGTGEGLGTCNLTLINGGLFFDTFNETGEVGYAHEDNPTFTVQWRSGRYARSNRRTRRHWTGVRILTRNAHTTQGGQITVAAAFDGGSFTTIGTINAAGLADTRIALDTVANDIELRLTWLLNGDTTTERGAPATVLQIIYEGRELPVSTWRRHTMVVEGDYPAQAGGVRSKQVGDSLRDDLEALTGTSSDKLTFQDPYRSSRTVIVNRAMTLNPDEADRLRVPYGSVRVELFEVPS